MGALQLRWLGYPVVEQGGKTVKLETRKATALLSYLSLTPGECQRELIATMFWPEGSQQKALANLRRTLSSLNASLPGWIEADRETILLKRDGNLWMDMEAFREFLENTRQHKHPGEQICDECLSALEKATELYRGEFLEGLNLSDAPGFDEWQFFHRDSLCQEYAQVLQRLAAGHRERDQWDRAIFYARKWSALDPLDEPACRALMDLYARSGQRNAALRQYEELVRFLGEQTGQDPEPETRRVYEQVRGREDSKQALRAESQTGPFPLLKTKLYIPAVSASRVIRSELIERLGEVENRALTVISAPAGFGKTTLLAEWIAKTSLPVAWLSLDSGDNDPYRFLAYLVAALENIQEELGGQAQQLMRTSQAVPVHIILASLINDLEKVATPYALILDDYQFISEHAIHETVAYLLYHLPINMHILIASRADPPLQLGRLRAHNQMLELRTADLRFTPDEAAKFLNDVMQLGLSAENIKTLEARTEGWVAGLQMAALSLKGHKNISAFIRDFSGSHRYVLDYLVEEVLKRQPAHIQIFLLRTSVLEKLNGSLCDALMTDEWKQFGENGQSVLEYLESSNLFVIPLDDHKQWYRYHQLFADLLRARLQSSSTTQGVAQLHTRASEWYAQNDSVLDAIHHAAMALDDEMVERLTEQHYIEMVSRGEMFEMRYWTGKLNREQVYRRPLLCVYAAYSHAWFGELDEADFLLEKAEELIRSPACSDFEAHAMQGLLAYIKSRVTAMRGNLSRAIEICLWAREHIPSNELAPQLEFDTRVTLGYEYFLIGDYPNASRVLSETIHLGIKKGVVIHTVAASCILARLYTLQGMLQKAHETYQKAAQLISHADEEHRDARALVEAGLADVFYEWNELDAALIHVKQGLNLMSWWGKTDDFVLAYITRARIHMARACYRDAAETLEKAANLVQTRGVFPEVLRVLNAAWVKLWLSQNNKQALDSWSLAQAEYLNSGERLGFENELARIRLARVWIAQDRFDKALGLLAHLEEIARSAGRTGRVIEILLLQALALRGTGETEHAIQALTECLSLAAPEGYVRIFLDEGRPMRMLLDQWLVCNSDGLLRDYVRQLLSQFDSGASVTQI